VRVVTCSTAAHKHSANLRKLHEEFCHRLQSFREADNAIKHFDFSFIPSCRKAQHSLQMKLMVWQSETDLRNSMRMKLVEFFWRLSKLKFGILLDFGRKTLSIFESTYICEETFSRIKKQDTKLGHELKTNIRVRFRSLQPPHLFQILESMLMAASVCLQTVPFGAVNFQFRHRRSMAAFSFTHSQFKPRSPHWPNVNELSIHFHTIIFRKAASVV
jgi:hypothetical protein